MHFDRAFLWAGIVVASVVASGQAVRAADPEVPADLIYEKEVEYSNPDGQHLQMNIARPRNAKGPLPAVLCIHGGGFRAGHRDGYNNLIIRLAQRGFVA